MGCQVVVFILFQYNIFFFFVSQYNVYLRQGLTLHLKINVQDLALNASVSRRLQLRSSFLEVAKCEIGGSAAVGLVIRNLIG